MSESTTLLDGMRSRLIAVYGAEQTPAILARILNLIGEPKATLRPSTLPLSEKDVVLITYADQVQQPGERSLVTLRDFLSAQIGGLINTVHILPFYPYSSDDGFSVIDYEAVNPDFGLWEDVVGFQGKFRLMYDAVFNHISAKSAWFQGFLKGQAPYKDYFISVDPALDLSLVRRPRALPLLTRFETASGPQHVWTTFSDDQIDLNAANPDVLIDLLRILLFYVEKGATLIRLDAIAYLWKQIGTACIHLPQTHAIVQIMRDVLDMVAPHVILITETNVPHDENISYLGDGANEAQMVYQFSLPPLTLHTFRTGDATALTEWARTIYRISDRASYFNFTASHDGVGVTPAKGLLPQADIDALIAMVRAHGGFVSVKNNSDGTTSPYEMNISYFDGITDPAVTAKDPALACRRFIASQAIMLAFQGVPGIYFHSLFGSRSFHAGVEQTKRYRTINREKLTLGTLQAELADPDGIRRRVFDQYRHLLEIRTAESAFHPLGNQQVLSMHRSVFGLERTSPDGSSRVLALVNTGSAEAKLTLPAGNWRDLISGAQCDSKTMLAPYQVAWLKRG